MNGITAIVPLKAGVRAKRRLAHVLDAASRDRLVRVLARHVVSVLTSCGLPTILLVSAAPAAPEEPAWDGDVRVWKEPAPGLNAGLRAAMHRTGLPVLVVPSDLPWLERSDVERLLAEPGDVVVAPTFDGGTGALLMRRPVPPSFGPWSAFGHTAAARSAGLRARAVRVAGFERDLDDESALVRARRAPALLGTAFPIAERRGAFART